MGYGPEKEIWLDRSAMALDAAVAGLGVVLESDLLASEELRAGKLIAPFGDRRFHRGDDDLPSRTVQKAPEQCKHFRLRNLAAG